ncbi:MAG: NTP transferase domain-containing protein [Bacteroidetes bacterium]|nr:NTP transferase domain-containing protein [Bacteroidota bacterium]
MASKDFAVIMAGGIGSRFWPLSRHAHPKQFHDILGTGQSLLQTTWHRLLPLLGKDNIRVVTHIDYLPLVQAQLPDLDPAHILTEPMGRNTAPCIAYATWHLALQSPDAAIAVCPADHFIQHEDIYRQMVKQALEACRSRKAIVTMGIQPVRPDTGYGYIQYIEEPGERCYPVKTFTEKPSLEMARTFVESGEFVWNSGMFFFTAEVMQRELRRHMPDMAELFDSRTSRLQGKDRDAALAEIYSRCPAISIDYGVMEKAEEVYVMPADFGWSDLGTWTSLHALQPKDSVGNVVNGKARLYDAKGNMVQLPKGKLAIVKGVQGLFIVDTEDALLICPMDQEQEVRDIVQDLKQDKKNSRYL